jgi:hypothetical protein
VLEPIELALEHPTVRRNQKQMPNAELGPEIVGRPLPVAARGPQAMRPPYKFRNAATERSVYRVAIAAAKGVMVELPHASIYRDR